MTDAEAVKYYSDLAAKARREGRDAFAATYQEVANKLLLGTVQYHGPLSQKFTEE